MPPSALACAKVDTPEKVQRLRAEYLRTLVAPMDGMWEATSIAHGTFWEIRDPDRPIGHYCLDQENCLLRFHLVEDSRAHAQHIFHWVISTFHIGEAIASTVEPLYFSACLDRQIGVMPHTYLFRDGPASSQVPNAGNHVFQSVKDEERAHIGAFYRVNAVGPGEWIDEFVSKRIARGELFALYDGDRVLATGECIPSKDQPPYADLGVVVARQDRGRGLGTSVLSLLKEHCYRNGLQPICSCAADNHASRRAIEKAGFVAEHRMVRVRLSHSRKGSSHGTY